MEIIYHAFLMGVCFLLSSGIFASEGDSSKIKYIQVKPNIFKSSNIAFIDESLGRKKIMNFEDKRSLQKKFINFEINRKIATYKNDLDISAWLVVPSLSILLMMDAENNVSAYRTKREARKTSLDLIGERQLNIR